MADLSKKKEQSFYTLNRNEIKSVSNNSGFKYMPFLSLEGNKLLLRGEDLSIGVNYNLKSSTKGVLKILAKDKSQSEIRCRAKFAKMQN